MTALSETSTAVTRRRWKSMDAKEARLAWAKGARVRVNCEVLRDGVLLAHGHTVHACLDRGSGRIIRVPSEITACCPEAADDTS